MPRHWMILTAVGLFATSAMPAAALERTQTDPTADQAHAFLIAAVQRGGYRDNRGASIRGVESAGCTTVLRTQGSVWRDVWTVDWRRISRVYSENGNVHLEGPVHDDHRHDYGSNVNRDITLQLSVPNSMAERIARAMETIRASCDPLVGQPF